MGQRRPVQREYNVIVPALTEFLRWLLGLQPAAAKLAARR